MMRKYAIPALFPALLILLVSLILAGESPANKKMYVGEKKCKKCHQRDGIYQSWSISAHAKAWESLNEEQQTDQECISCHSTGEDILGQTLRGVQCEACHGPGKEHKKLSLAPSKEGAQRTEATFIGEDTCLKCHNDDVPEEFRSGGEFNFAEAVVKGAHARSVNIGHELNKH